ncbi:cobalamin biosynthesis protein CbiL [uncultured Cohaesibacter sp.]|uniref:cobalamin biosynthesis protein CbiL n=1 Tax=uncultured Cohaesibacter sp. TaxID=1002546 RepID=UPI0029C9520C|nr:cobalamin biosynthesis protein CbiL [uncultured Cohaesibacter sp.]
MIRLVTFLLFCLCLSEPTLAHSLRVFATVEGSMVTGYGFFVGGGRPFDVEWKATMSDEEIATGKTDREGGFRFEAPATVTGPVTVTINSGEGHIASRELRPDRFGASEAAHVTEAAPVSHKLESPDATLSNDSPALTEALIETAVAREIAPLLERIEQMDSRLRLTDIVSGICLIVGIAGIALWARGRRS